MSIATINITSNQTWTISGPAWIPALPISGSGNFAYTPIPSANSTGAYRSGNILITYQDGTVDTCPVVQYESGLVNGKIFVMGLDDDEGQFVKYRISLADGRTMTDTNTSCGNDFDFTNYPQAGIMPINGNTVSLLIYTDDDYKTFSLNFGNNAYWLSSSTQYDNGQDVIDNGATAITLVSTSPNYSGSFVYAKGGDFFYIVLDYRNIIECASGTVDADITRSYYPINIDISYGNTSVGLASFEYTLISPYDVYASYNDATIIEDESSTTNSTVFFKSDTDEEYVRAVISNRDNPITGTVVIDMSCPSLTSFTIYRTGFSTSALACADTGSTTTRYHNGIGALPDIGDIVYTDASGSIYVGDNLYYRVGTYAYLIDTEGNVLSITNCVCSEVAIPVITAIPDIYVEVGVPSLFKLEATLNPTSWAFDSPYNEYTISGNDEGGTYTYVDINGCAKNGSVGIGETQTIYGNTFVMSSYGDASVSSAGAVYYPQNIFIDSNGEIGVKFDISGTYTYDVIATNCFGDSAPVTITFIVKHPPTLAPFNMIGVGECSSVDACASTEPYQQFWFNNNPCEGTCVYPEINDIIYIDGYGEQYMNGGYLYYAMDNGDWLLIDGIGQVVNKGTC